jgi:hypothetical protein
VQQRSATREILRWLCSVSLILLLLFHESRVPQKFHRPYFQTPRLLA